MITREQVADLQPGDVVRVHIEGPVVRVGGELQLSDGRLLQWADGSVASWVADYDLTVVSRAPRPLYVNHPRTEPVAGDVVSRGDKDGAAWSYCPRTVRDLGNRWRNTANDEWFADEDFLDFGNGLRLLVDGTTGEVVP